MSFVSKIPWWAKIGGKLLLSKLPVPYSYWKRMGLFRHGEMDNPDRAIETFNRYYHRALKYGKLPKNFNVLELGPGDSILSGIVAHAYGANHVWMVDAGSFAGFDISVCQTTVNILKDQGMILPSIELTDNIDRVLSRFNINYLTEGIQSLEKIPDQTIDFFWSQVMLEHVRKEEFPALLKQLRRIVRTNAVGVHSIDFRDHLSGGLNNLRFNTKLWESNFFCNAGFYTNRLRPCEMLRLFEESGFFIEILSETRWDHLPIQRRLMADEFQVFSDEDFMVAEIDIILRPN